MTWASLTSKVLTYRVDGRIDLHAAAGQYISGRHVLYSILHCHDTTSRCRELHRRLTSIREVGENDGDGIVNSEYLTQRGSWGTPGLSGLPLQLNYSVCPLISFLRQSERFARYTRPLSKPRKGGAHSIMRLGKGKADQPSHGTLAAA